MADLDLFRRKSQRHQQITPLCFVFPMVFRRSRFWDLPHFRLTGTFYHSVDNSIFIEGHQGGDNSRPDCRHGDPSEQSTVADNQTCLSLGSKRQNYLACVDSNFFNPHEMRYHKLLQMCIKKPSSLGENQSSIPHSILNIESNY